MPIDESTGREYDESLDFSSGFLDDVDALVAESRFGVLEGYNDRDGNPQCLAILTLQPLDAKGKPDGDPIEQVWSCGSGWEPSDDGRSAIHPSGRRKFNKGCMWARLLARCMQLYPEVKFRGKGDVAGILDGLVFHWKQEKFSYGGEIGDREHLMAEKFLREQKKGRTTGSPASGPAKSGGAASAASDDDWETELTALALAEDDHKAFVKAVVANKSLTEQIRAAGKMAHVLSSKEDGFWAQARA
jgi:hypothetical protein